MRLTAKQDAFAQAIASGSTQADAYRKAYNAGGMKDGAIYREASLLLDNPKVAKRVEELRAEVARRNLWTREMSVKALAEAYKLARDQGQAGAMTGAVRELNVMHGFNEPARVDHTSSDGSMSPAGNDYDAKIKAIRDRLASE